MLTLLQFLQNLYSKTAAQAPTRKLLKGVITEVIQSRDRKILQNASVVLLGVPTSKNDTRYRKFSGPWIVTVR